MLAFNTTQEQLLELKKYEFSGDDDLGVTVESTGKRTIIAIYCRIDRAYTEDSYDEYEDEYEDEEEDNDRRAGFVAEDSLLNLLVQIHQQIIGGDFRTLYVVWGNMETLIMNMMRMKYQFLQIKSREGI